MTSVYQASGQEALNAVYYMHSARMSCNKKNYKKFDVTIDITLNECYSTTMRCNK